MPGHTIVILGSTSTILMAAAQYTILKDKHSGHHNWQELLGIVLVIFGSIAPSVYDVIQMYCTDKDIEDAGEIIELKELNSK